MNLGNKASIVADSSAAAGIVLVYSAEFPNLLLNQADLQPLNEGHYELMEQSHLGLIPWGVTDSELNVSAAH